MDNDKKEPPGANFSFGSVFQSARIQRGICWYNDAHRYLLECFLSYVLYSGHTILNLFGIKKV